MTTKSTPSSCIELRTDGTIDADVECCGECHEEGEDRAITETLTDGREAHICCAVRQYLEMHGLLVLPQTSEAHPRETRTILVKDVTYPSGVTAHITVSIVTH